MKYISLVLFLLICFSSQHDCEAGVFDVKITIDDQPAFDATFSAKILKTPIGDNLKGWGFKIEGKEDFDSIKTVFSNIKNKYYLSYRSLTNRFEGHSIEGEGKSISTTFSSDLGENSTSHSIKIQFTYDPEWNVISDGDFNKLLDWLNSNRIQRINYIRSLKEQINQEANHYHTNKTNSDLSKKNKEEVAKKITELKDKAKRIKEENDKKKEELNKTFDSIHKNGEKINQIKGELSDLESDLAQLKGKLDSQMAFLKNLVAAKSTNNENKEKYASDAKNAMDAISGLVNLYKEEATTDGWLLDVAVVELAVFKDQKRFDKNIKVALSSR